MITVSFARNNPDNGLRLEKIAAVEIHGNSCDLEFEGPHFLEASNVFREVDKPANAPDRCDAGFQIGRHIFPCYGWKTWYGNWCWDATRMTGVDTLVLVRTLRELNYRCVAGCAKFGDAYDAGHEITPQMLTEALS